MRIAVMQPYFIPYAGYFRLFASTDLVVFFDCVQFLRRGWIHRNRLPNTNNELQWLTLPLLKQSQDVLIKDLKFSDDAETEWKSRLSKFEYLFNNQHANADLIQCTATLPENPTTFLIDTLRLTCKKLNLPFEVALSSSLSLPKELKGQERILAIAKHYNANEYINLAGGKELYDANVFKKHGLELKFLTEYQGSYASILYRCLTEDAASLNNDIITQSKVDNLCNH